MNVQAGFPGFAQRSEPAPREMMDDSSRLAVYWDEVKLTFSKFLLFSICSVSARSLV